MRSTDHLKNICMEDAQLRAPAFPVFRHVQAVAVPCNGVQAQRPAGNDRNLNALAARLAHDDDLNTGEDSYKVNRIMTFNTLKVQSAAGCSRRCLPPPEGKLAAVFNEIIKNLQQFRPGWE